ncbi:anti-sigma factor family protein [Demequina sp.]|uniref:anti-sigma factor family protein n=1 Tax=Demequina sp. TaxID=2050685 RepID=UPI003D0AFEAD
MTDKHLGDRIHDLLDGRLSPQDTSVAMSHLAACDECNERWQELRTAREALNSSSAGIDMRFAQMLLDKDRMAQIAKGESKHVARAAKGRDKRPATIAASAAVILGFTVVAAYLAGAPDTVDANLVAMADSGDRSTAVLDVQGMDNEDLTNWVQPDWQASGLIPVDAKVVRHGDAEILVASLLVGLDPVVIVEQRGRLSDAVVDQAPRVSLDDFDIYVVSTAPVQVLWQSGSVVIGATCTCALDTLAIAAAAFPEAGEPGVMDQIGTGFGVFGDALTGH